MNDFEPTVEKAGIVAYQRRDGVELEVLLVSARSVSGSWVFPVGHVDPGESAEAAARRECVEESGYSVAIESELTAFVVDEGGERVRFTFFLASVICESGKGEPDRQRKWVPFRRLAETVPKVFRGVARDALQRLAGAGIGCARSSPPRC